MFTLHDVLSAHSFSFVKQDRATCRRYMHAVNCQNGEQVSRTVLTLCFQLVCHGPPGSWHAAVSPRAGEENGKITASVSHRSLQRMPSNGGEFSRWLDRRISRGSVCVTKPRMRTYTTNGRIGERERPNRDRADTRTCINVCSGCITCRQRTAFLS